MPVYLEYCELHSTLFCCQSSCHGCHRAPQVDACVLLTAPIFLRLLLAVTSPCTTPIHSSSHCQAGIKAQSTFSLPVERGWPRDKLSAEEVAESMAPRPIAIWGFENRLWPLGCRLLVFRFCVLRLLLPSGRNRDVT